jgi:hypothetical protein
MLETDDPARKLASDVPEVDFRVVFEADSAVLIMGFKRAL